MVLKFVMVIDLVLEFIMYLFEVYKLNQLSQSSVDVVVRFSEKRRRRAFAYKYIARTGVWLLLALIGMMICLIAVKKQDCDEGQAMNWWRVCSTCQVENCLDCSTSGDPNQCDECKPGYFYDEELGVCGDCDNNPEIVKCAKCTGYDSECTECA